MQQVSIHAAKTHLSKLIEVTRILLDTHTWAWSLAADKRLSKRARAAIKEADTVLVSPITFCEISQKVRLGKWAEMAAFVQQLPGLLREQGGSVAELDPAICVAAGMMDWPHRDPFDRLLAATAIHYNLPMVSSDTVFDSIIKRFW